MKKSEEVIDVEYADLSEDGREMKFYDYNKDNIMINLHQIEQHLRDLNREDVEGNQHQCIKKHSMMVQGELDEAISHATVSSPRDVEFLKTLKENIIIFRKDLDNHTPEENMIYIREIRKSAETLDPEEYDTSQCKACGPVDENSPPPEMIPLNEKEQSAKDRVTSRIRKHIEKIESDIQETKMETEDIQEEIHETIREINEPPERDDHFLTPPFLRLRPPFPFPPLREDDH